MPTNEFQELVKLIEQSLYSKNAKIVCPAFVQGQGLDEFREVDILITDQLGPRTIKIAVEATDLGRPLGIGKFEAFLAKYRGEGRVAVQDFYIVTRKGFTEDVRERAMLADVELITLADAQAADWTNVIRRPDKFITQSPPFICSVGFVPPMPNLTTARMKDVRLRCEHGTDLGTAAEYAKKLFFNRLVKEQPDLLPKLTETAKNDPLGGAHLKVEFPPCHQFYAILDGQEHPIEKIWFQVHKNYREGTSETHCYERTSTKEGTKHIIHTKGQAGGVTMEMAMEMLKEGGRLTLPKSIALKMSGLPMPPNFIKRPAAEQVKQPKAKRSKGKGKR